MSAAKMSQLKPVRPSSIKDGLFHMVYGCLILLIGQTSYQANASLSMKRLYEELFTDYNRLIIPIAPNKTKVTVTLGLKLGQILDLNLKQQILSTNVWVEQTWHDHRLEWDPKFFGGIDMIHVPAENIWIPDIVLFNNADGNYELTLVAKAILYANGTVVWKPPTMFRSTCEIDVEYFPFDIQTCFLRFGSWTYAGDEVEIRHVSQKKRKVDIGIDLSQFYKNVEWDIIDVPAYYNENYYECCQEPYPDITFKIVIRRKMLFYLVNLILPVALMTFMTVSVFYLPADSNEKVTLSISILTSLIVFFLLMLEIIPPTSLAVPLFGKYLLFTLVLVSLSACVSVYVLNMYHRAPSVHQMSPRMRQLFLKTLPRLLRLDRPDPRERSSLNRFRKKKIAQQILQARQHNKVYDLAQPLAASLNLIETLHKSYQSIGEDDKFRDKSGKKKDTKNFLFDDDEEGRYFRKYIDHYIEQLRLKEANSRITERDDYLKNLTQRQSSSSRSHEKSFQACFACPGAITAKSANARGSCCERCCQGAFESLKDKSNQCMNSTPQQVEWTTESSDIMRPFVPASTARCHLSNHCNGCHLGDNSNSKDPQCQQGLGMLNDDTLDMTFDYEDQEETGLILPSAHFYGNRNSGRPIGQDLTDDLPSPPPPPKQLTQLSDSMRDLSGRVSSSSANQLRNNCVQHDDHLDKLISSINMINNASDEIDTTSVTSTATPVGEAGFIMPRLDRMNLKADFGNGPPHGQRTQLTRPVAGGNQCKTVNGMHQTTTLAPQFRQCTCNRDTVNKRSVDECSCHLSASRGREHTGRNYPGVSGSNDPPSKQNNGAKSTEDIKPSEILLSLRLPYDKMPAHVRAAIRSILFIADTIKNEDDENSAIEDWESVSMVIDRLFLWIFFLLCTFGSLIILALAPSLYDQRDSIDDKLLIEIPTSNCTALN